MTREEAQRESERLSREHADRETHHWFPREGAGGVWSVVKVAQAPNRRVDPLTATTEAKPKPPQADDPRTTFERLVPPYGAGGG